MSMEKPEHLDQLREWLLSYKPEELFNEDGSVKQEIVDMAPKGNARMGANPHANGGLLLKDLRLPDFREYGVKDVGPGETQAQDMIELGAYVRDIFTLNKENKTSVFSDRTNLCLTVCIMHSKLRIVLGMQICTVMMTTLHWMDVSWMVCFLSICVKHGWKLIFLPDVMVSLLLTKHLSVL